jgi:hypothetical protein
MCGSALLMTGVAVSFRLLNHSISDLRGKPLCSLEFFVWFLAPLAALAFNKFEIKRYRWRCDQHIADCKRTRCLGRFNSYLPGWQRPNQMRTA